MDGFKRGHLHTSPITFPHFRPLRHRRPRHPPSEELHQDIHDRAALSPRRGDPPQGDVQERHQRVHRVKGSGMWVIPDDNVDDEKSPAELCPVILLFVISAYAI